MMIPLRYDMVRWVIAVLTLFLIMAGVVLRPTGGASILFFLLVLASVGAIVSPPGLFIWLLTPICPACRGRVEWVVEQGSANPYLEELVIRCPTCEKQKTEFSFDPT